ncbi:Alpha/Beta hydrolase protein [Rhypophila sp. PSN 637]
MVLTTARLLAALAVGTVVSALPASPSPPKTPIIEISKFKVPHKHAVDGPTVDLGYSRYQGQYDPKFDTNIFLGIRYAAPPKRWQLPEEPAVDLTAAIKNATAQPPRCPQSPSGPARGPLADASIKGEEDCLFLNVFSPNKAKNLPVLVWIHGGGYGLGDAASFDFSQLTKTSGNAIVTVVIQYRLGAFGFLSSADLMKQGGTPNAAVHDMRFALQWVQKYISRFGGDPAKVTISGESAGGGAVMLMALANGGTENTTLFRGGIASSPYLPTQPDYDGDLPTENYLQFAQKAGCLGTADASSSSEAVYKCLLNANSTVLQRASAEISNNAKVGQWAFIPVTDGTLLRSRPTKQLLRGQINGQRVITGHNGNEGTYFVPQNITTQQSFIDFIKVNYPAVNDTHIASILELYAVPASSLTSPKFDTDGINPPYATSVSGYAVGWQQAANNLYAETTFVCPAYWLADAYATRQGGKSIYASWRYQFSIPNAFHGSDLQPIFEDPAVANARVDATFKRGFQSIWAQFITKQDPGLYPDIINADGGVGKTALSAASRDNWWPWGYVGGNQRDAERPRYWHMLNMNVTTAADGKVKADWKIVDGRKFEGNRGARCDLWAKLGDVIEE